MSATKTIVNHAVNYGTATAVAVYAADYLMGRYGIPEAVTTGVILFLFHRLRPLVDKLAMRFNAWVMGVMVIAFMLSIPVASATPVKAVIMSRSVDVYTPQLDDQGRQKYDNEGTALDFVETVDVPELYLDLSISLDFFTIDWKTKEYTVGVSPGIGYGLKWAPEFWTFSSSPVK